LPHAISPEAVWSMSRTSPKDEPLDLAALGRPPGMPGLTATAGRFLAEAAAVCLERCGHGERFDLPAVGWRHQTYLACRPSVDGQMTRTYGDLQEATEHGACAVAILVTKELTGFEVIERSAKGTGFDYWVGEDEQLPFQSKTRLEVSGILRGTLGDIEQRVREKCHQTERSDGMGLAALVFVVEFSQPIVKVIKR
jgi:hypothetical protein